MQINPINQLFNNIVKSPILLLRKVFYHSNMLYSIRILICLTGAVLFPWYVDDIALAIPLTLGVAAAALTDIDTRLFSRLINAILTLFCFALASFSVQVLFPYPIIFIIGLIISTFGFTMLGALGQRYAVIAFGSLLIAAYTMLGYEIFADFYTQPVYLLIGAIWYNVVAFIGAIFLPIQTTQQSLSINFFRLAQFLNAKAAMFDPDESNDFVQQSQQLAEANSQLVQSLNQTKHSLFNRLKSYRGQSSIRHMLNYYFVAQDIHERISAAHVNYQTLSKHLKHSDILFRFARILSLQSSACARLARSIKYGQPYEHDPMFEKYFFYLEEALARHQGNPHTIRALTNLKNNLYSVVLLLASVNSEQQKTKQYEQAQIIDDELSNLKDIWIRLKQNFTVKSSLFRHAVRMCIVFTVGYAIIQFSNLPHGYWIILTSLFVCQPNYSTTKYRLRLRVLGTIAGIIVAIPLIYSLPNENSYLFFIVLTGWLFFLFKNSQYAYATAFITLLVFFCFGLIGANGWSVALYRLIATLIGCLIAWLAVSFIWPDWKFRNIAAFVARACHDNCHYLALIGTQYQEGKNNDVSYRLIRRAVHDNSADLSSLVSIMTKEPHTNPEVIEKAFRFATLNNTFVSYISTLGAHRDKSISEETLSLFDDVAVYIITTLHGDQKIDKDYTMIRQVVADTLDKASDDNDFLVLQQLLLILDLLPEISQLTEALCKNSH